MTSILALPERRAVRLYEQVDARIRERLLNRVWRPGLAIPAESQLAAEFGVSLGTVRRAVEALVSEGVLVRRHGSGTFVVEALERRSFHLNFNFVTEDGERAPSPTARLLKRSSGRATIPEARLLGIPPRANVLRFERLRIFTGMPVVVETIVVAETLFPGLGSSDELANHLFPHYEAVYGQSVVRTEERIRAVIADPADAELLRLSPGSPLLSVDRLAMSLDGRVIEWRRSRCDTSHHRFVVKRSGDARP